MPPLPPSNPHRPHGYAAEAREWLVEYLCARDPIGDANTARTRADLFLAEAWAAGLKLVPLEEHDLDIGKVA